VNGPRLRVVPGRRDREILDWIALRETADAGPVLDPVFDRLDSIRQEQPRPWDPLLDVLSWQPAGRALRVTLLVGTAAVLVVLMVATLLVVSGGGPLRGPASPAPATPGAVFPLADARLQIVIAGGDGNMYVQSSDGSPRRRIALDVTHRLMEPAWLGSGDRALVVEDTGVTQQVWQVDPAGEAPSQVVLPCVLPCRSRAEVSASHDGSKIVFFEATGEVVNGIPATCGLRVYDVGTQRVESLTSGPCGRVEEREPRFSPDDTKVAFWRSRAPGTEPTTSVESSAIFVKTLATGAEVQVTDWSFAASSVDWAPDGRSLVFRPTWWVPFDPSGDLWRVGADGGGLARLTYVATASQATWQPRFSPDGQWVLFSLISRSGSAIWAVPAAGGDPVAVLPGSPDAFQFDALAAPARTGPIRSPAAGP
jgi:Tol biopolymer transport system component